MKNEYRICYVGEYGNYILYTQCVFSTIEDAEEYIDYIKRTIGVKLFYCSDSDYHKKK